MVVSSGIGPSLPDGMGVHRTLLAGSLRSSGGSDKDSSQKLTDFFAIVNTFLECATVRNPIGHEQHAKYHVKSIFTKQVHRLLI